MISPQAMRSLDRLLGVPLCFLLTGWRYLRRSLWPVDDRSFAPKRVLFIELAEMGSVILADPALREVQRRFNATPFFLIFEQNRGCLRLTKSVREDNVFGLRTESLFCLLIDSFRLVVWLRKRQIDTVIDLELFTRFSAFLAFVLGIRQRVGFHRFADEGLYRGNLFTHPVRYDAQRHMAANFLALLDALAPAPQSTPGDAGILAIPQRLISVAECDSVKARIAGLCPGFDWRRHRLALINANSSEFLPQRRWPAANYVKLIELLLARHSDLFVALIGADSDRLTAGEIEKQLADPRCQVIAGFFEIEELPALFACSALMVSNDSGPAHFAAVSSMPTIVLFGPETPRLYAPLSAARVLSANLPCSPCVNPGNQRRSDCADNRCLQAITVEQVLDESLRLLETPVDSNQATGI
jgi:ADP-heptose:LPS heptosyltransferase